MSTRHYSEDQRRIAAASFYMMSQALRAKRKEIKVDRDIFLILVCLYISHHAGETVNIAKLVEPVGKQWGTIKDKVDSLQQQGLVSLEDHPSDGRSVLVKALPKLFDKFGPILDDLVDIMRMSTECIKQTGPRQNLRAKDRDKFCDEIVHVCRIETLKNNAKTNK